MSKILEENIDSKKLKQMIGLINILHDTLKQLQEWAIEKYGVNKEEIKLTQKDFFKACPYTNTEKNRKPRYL